MGTRIPHDFLRAPPLSPAVRLVPVRLVPVRLVPVRLVPVRLVPVRLVPVRLVPVRLVPVRRRQAVARRVPKAVSSSAGARTAHARPFCCTAASTMRAPRK